MRVSAMARILVPVSQSTIAFMSFSLTMQTASSPKRPSWATQAVTILKKDLLIELRSGEVVTTSAFFAALVVIIASFAFYGGPSTRRLVAAGALWLSVTFAAVLALGRAWQREREEGALTGLLV